MKEFWSWLIPRALILIAFVAYIAVAIYLDHWRFDECRAAGLADRFCAMQYPIGAHK